MARLDEVCSINMGQSPDSSSYNESGIGIPFFQGNADFGSIHPKIRVWCNAPTKIAQSGEILISVRAPIGALNIADTKCCIGRGLAALTINDELCIKEYLWHAIATKVEELNEKGTGSTFKAISKNILAETMIPLPSKKEQIRISITLDKVNDLITIRKQQIAKLDELVKLRFIEMFGDPLKNPKQFPVFKVDDIIDFQGGSQPEKKYFEYVKSNDNIRFIQIRDYKSDRFITYIPKTMSKRFCTTEDIMIGRYGPPIFQILQGIEGSYNVALMKAVPKKGNREFIRHYLKQECLLRYLEGLSQRTAGQDGIQMDELKTYPFPYPPLETQDSFANIVKQIDKSKSEIQISLEKLEILKKALMQQYFE